MILGDFIHGSHLTTRQKKKVTRDLEKFLKFRCDSFLEPKSWNFVKLTVKHPFNPSPGLSNHHQCIPRSRLVTRAILSRPSEIDEIILSPGFWTYFMILVLEKNRDEISKIFLSPWWFFLDAPATAECSVVTSLDLGIHWWWLLSPGLGLNGCFTVIFTIGMLETCFSQWVVVYNGEIPHFGKGVLPYM